MKLSELIAAYGDDKVQFQNLDQCGRSLDFHHKKGTTITFVTEMNIYAPEGTEKLGLVVWLDRNRVAALLEESRGRTSS